MTSNTAISQKVLVVCNSLKQTIQPLDQAGFQIMTATDSEDALYKLSRHHPDAVIILDGMAPLAGRQLHSRLRDMSVVPIIILGNREEVERVMIIEDGADLYLNSTISSQELAAYLHSLIRRYQRHINGVAFDIEENSRSGYFYRSIDSAQDSGYFPALPSIMAEGSPLSAFATMSGKCQKAPWETPRLYAS